MYMHLLPIKIEMDFCGKREKITFQNNRFITILADVKTFFGGKSLEADCVILILKYRNPYT